MDKARVIGLTGVAGSGKSSVRSWLAQHGFASLDADEVTRALLEEPPVIQALLEAFDGGPVLRSREGPARIDRAALARIVFEDERSLARLEAILHPRVVEATREWMRAKEASPRVIEAIKLVESGMADEVDEVWLVFCDRRERQRRLVERGWSPEEAARRIRAGRSFGEHLADCDRVIDNSGAFSVTRLQLEAALRRSSPGLAANGPAELDNHRGPLE